MGFISRRVILADNTTVNGQRRSDGNSVDVFRALGAGNTPLSTVADIQLLAMKSSVIRNFLFIVLSVCLTQQPSARAQSVTEDLSSGRTYKFQITPKLSPFTFKLVPLIQPPDQYGNAQSTIRDIEVYREGSRRAFQHLIGCDLDDMLPPGIGAEFFTAEDMNFDGYKDIFLETLPGATGNSGGCVWLFNPSTGSFDYSKDFSRLSSFYLDPVRKTIFSFVTGGMLGSVFNANRYVIEGNRPVLVWSETQDWDDPTKRFHCVMRKRRANAMIVVRDAWSQGFDAPCEIPVPGKQ